MTPFVFKFMGAPAQRGQAVEALRLQLPPNALVTPKTNDLVEVRLEDAEAVSILPVLQREFASLWEVALPTYAEISPPAFNWTMIRNKLGA